MIMKNFALILALSASTLALGQTHQVTFEVNMSNEIVAASGVFLAGGADFGVPGTNPMTDDDGDGTYSITVELADGYSGYYTFTNGACADWSCKESLVGQPCGVAANFYDRFLEPITMDTTLSTCFAQCTTDGSCNAPEEPLDVTFNVDMSTTAVAGAVYITGLAIDNWCGNCVEMFDDNGDGVYSLTMQLEPGGYEYRFNNGGWDGQEDLTPEDDADCTLTTGAFTNRLITVSGAEPLVVDTVCFSECAACSGDPVDPITSDVTFSVDMSNETVAGPVYITGLTIDDWCGTCVEMLDEDGDQVYTITLPLAEGAHEFKYNNGGWEGTEALDATEDAECTLTTGEFTNRIYTVTDSLPGDLGVVCFNSCEACAPVIGINEISALEFGVYPSVTDGAFAVRFNELTNKVANLTVRRMDGGLVLEQQVVAGTSVLNLDATNWEAGIYLVHCSNAFGGGVQRIIKIQ